MASGWSLEPRVRPPPAGLGASVGKHFWGQLHVLRCGWLGLWSRSGFICLQLIYSLPQSSLPGRSRFTGSGATASGVRFGYYLWFCGDIGFRGSLCRGWFWWLAFLLSKAIRPTRPAPLMAPPPRAPARPSSRVDMARRLKSTFPVSPAAVASRMEDCTISVEPSTVAPLA